MKALLLIDLQIDFLSDRGRLPVGAANAGRVISIANRMIALFEEHRWPIVVIYNQFKKSDVIGNFFRRYSALEGSEGGRIDPRVLVHDAQHFSKAQSSAFSNHALSGYLQTAGIRDVVICGVYAEGCVRATALDAIKAGLDTVVLADGVTSNRNSKHKWALSHMKKRGIQVMSFEDYLSEHSTGTPETSSPTSIRHNM
jgi:nicotinamidase-related amidase